MQITRLVRLLALTRFLSSHTYRISDDKSFLLLCRLPVIPQFAFYAHPNSIFNGRAFDAFFFPCITCFFFSIFL